MTSLASELRVPSFCAALIRGAMERDSFASPQLHKTTEAGVFGLAWTGTDG